MKVCFRLGESDSPLSGRDSPHPAGKRHHRYSLSTTSGHGTGMGEAGSNGTCQWAVLPATIEPARHLLLSWVGWRLGC